MASGAVESMRAIGVVPVVTVVRPEQAVPLVRALCAGGLPCVEFTFRSEAAAAAIERVRADVPGALVGAGTVLTTAQADAAIESGAEFLVAPGFNPAIVDHVLDRGLPILPGIATPSELEAALWRDLHTVKVFPAASLGGPAYLRALAGPYPMMQFVPTGGVTPDTLAEYLRIPSVAAVGGTWLAKSNVIEAGDWAAVERLAGEAVAVVREVRGTSREAGVASVADVSTPKGNVA